MRTMAAGEFKAKCLAVMDEVQATGTPVLITKRGKVVARLVAPEETASRQYDAESIFGCLQGMATITGDIVSSPYSEDEWEQIFNEKWDRLERIAAE